MISWWPSLDDAIQTHCEAMTRDGLAPHHCDEAKLEGAILRPQNRHHYDGITDVIELAGLLAAAVACGHSFTDGNKRTAFVLLALFLERNGFETTTSHRDESLARGIELIVDAYHRGEQDGDAQLASFTAYLRTVTRRQ